MINSPISIHSALCLSASDVEALGKGRMIAALSRTFVNAVQHFALCPVEQPKIDATIAIKFWAKLEFCKIYNSPEDVDKLALLTIWSSEELQKALQERYKLFLLGLRVFQVPKPIEISADQVSPSKIGGFIKLPEYLFIDRAVSVLPEDVLNQRQRQLVNLEAPPYPELERLHDLVAQLAVTDLKAKELELDIQAFLGWADRSVKKISNPNLVWMATIVDLGNRSREEEEKSNHRAGTDFEIVVRKSLEFLGFKIDPKHSGGAGGVDLFCSEPYPLIGECKSGKKIPNDTAVQLLNLGTIRLEDKETFNRAAKLIIGPGEPTEQLKKAAKVHGMAIINPATLEKLVNLHYKYPIDLFKLKNYLVDGQADDEVGKYIDQTIQTVRLRAYIVQLVKNFLTNSPYKDADITQLHAVYGFHNPPRPLDREEMNEILIELSSPLTGYLGRKKGDDGRDRFYFLRDMPAVD